MVISILNFSIKDASKYDDYFIEHKFIPKMVYQGLSLYNQEKTILAETFLNDFYNTSEDNYISAWNIIQWGFYNISWRRRKDTDSIELKIGGDRLYENVPGTNAKLYELCATINNGNRSGLDPYPIFSNAFNLTYSQINRLYSAYINGGF